MLFRGNKKSAVATVEHLKGSKVPVLLWSLGDLDEKSLDIYEGYPNLYRKEIIKINVDGEEVEGMIYLMNKGKIGEPNKEYLKIIADGYKSAGFDINILLDAFFKSKEMAEKQAFEEINYGKIDYYEAINDYKEINYMDWINENNDFKMK